MADRLITPPASMALSLADAKDALKIDTNDQDAMVTAWVKGITAHAEDYTARAFITQTWRTTLDAFPSAITLLHPPAIGVTVLKYKDAAGVLQTLAPTEYMVDLESEPAQVLPARGKSWPSTYPEINAVQVDYQVGYGAADTAIPDGIRLYLIAKLREQYDPAIRAEMATVQSSFLDRILDGYMVYA
jgi:uncharacterized phiE125 gp8 family phage protein